MAVKFRCPMCGKRLTVEESPGNQTTCPHCSQAITVPADAAESGAGGGAADAAAALNMAPAVQPHQMAGQSQQQEEEPPPGGVDNMMGWLALYLPSWGTSFILHVAVVILMVFMAWQVQVTQPPAFEYKSGIVQQNAPKVEKNMPKPKRPSKDASQSGRGKGRPGPSSILHEYNGNPIPDVADGHTGRRLEVLGVGGGGNEIGGFEGLGSGSGRGFFAVGTQETAHKIAYIVDRSGSMTDSIDYVKYELKRSIGELDENTEFHVIFYSSGPPVEMPTRRLVSATDNNKKAAFEFIDSIVAQGETDPSKALEKAFAVGADLIYLLTDGEFDREIVGLVKRLNATGKTTVHTIGFIYKTGEPILKEIAAQNGGNYKFVSEADLAQLSN